MAFHFRKVRNTLRLFPSMKTIGFSTRANEGDGVNFQACSETSSAGRPSKPSDLRQGEQSDACNADPVSGLSRSQSTPDLVGNGLLPAILSSTANSLPITYSDLAQILRLPLPMPNCNQDLASDVASILRIVQPSGDDILAEPSVHPGLGQSYATDRLDQRREQIPLEVLDNNHIVRQSRPSNLHSVTPGFDVASLVASPVQTFSSGSHHGQDSLTSHLSYSSPDTMGTSRSPQMSGPQGKSPGKDGPTPEQMHKIKEKLEQTVSKLFSGRQDYSILHKNVVLENNLFGDNKTSMGVLAYGVEILKLRLRVHARFSNLSVELQSVTMLEQAGVIRIHWRLKGLSQIQTLKFWRLFQRGTTVSKDDYEWLDAFSYFHIGKDGLVHKHRIDRMIPDDASGKDKITETLRELLTPAKPLVS